MLFSGKIESRKAGVTSAPPFLTNTIFSEENSVAKNNISKICVVEGCHSPWRSRRLCHVHYERLRRNGSTTAIRPIVRGIGNTPEECFWSKVDRTPGQGPNGDCWEWQGGKQRAGYGSVRYRLKYVTSHVLAWTLTHGRRPTLHILHSCDNPPCCNPAHLREGTPKENVQDAVDRGRMARGDRLPQTKLTPDQVKQIRTLARCGWTLTQLAHRFGVTRSTCSEIVLRKTWRHVI